MVSSSVPGPGIITLRSPSAGSYPIPPVSITGMTSLTHSVVLLMAAWPGSGRMNDDGLVMAVLRSHCTSTLFSSTRMFLPLRLWQLSGSPGLEMQRLRSMVLVGALPGTLRRCFRTRIRSTIWVAWSTSHVRRSVTVPRSSE